MPDRPLVRRARPALPPALLALALACGGEPKKDVAIPVAEVRPDTTLLTSGGAVERGVAHVDSAALRQEGAGTRDEGADGTAARRAATSGGGSGGGPGTDGARAGDDRDSDSERGNRGKGKGKNKGKKGR